jgi:hypothetical protein
MKRYKCPRCGKQYETRMYCLHHPTLVKCIDQYPDDNSVKEKIGNLLDLLNNYREMIILFITLILSLYSFYLVCKVFAVIG